MDEYLGLKSAPKKELCPYGEPPEVEILGDEEWTINNTPRLEADHKCTLIISNADACATCPLADLSEEPKEAPSSFFQHLVWIADRQALGASFTYDTFSNLEWEGLKLLNVKRHEKTTRDMKAQQK